MGCNNTYFNYCKMCFSVLKKCLLYIKILFIYYHKALEIPWPAVFFTVTYLMTLLFLFNFISVQLRIRRFTFVSSCLAQRTCACFSKEKK